jgi:hypothetical protein
MQPGQQDSVDVGVGYKYNGNSIVNARTVLNKCELMASDGWKGCDPS